MGKNSKKKSKGRPAETGKRAAVENGEVSLPENRDSASERSYPKRNSSDDGESQSVGFQESDAEVEKREVDGVGLESILLQEEGQKESPSKEMAGFREELGMLKNEICNCIQKEENLQKTIEELQNERDSFLQKEVQWGEKLQELQCQVNSCLLEEGLLKEQLRIFGEEASSKEEYGKEAMLRLENANIRLHVEVNELEESRDRFIHENQLLLNSISLLQARVQQLEDARLWEEETTKTTEPTDGASKHQPVATELEAGLIPPNEPEKELVKKDNQPAAGHDDPSAHAFESIPIDDAASIARFDEPSTSPDASRGMALPQPPVEDEIQVLEDDREADGATQESEVPLTDAPLIGAPFRLISFVAKYVSGADLVQGQGSKIGR